MTTVETPMEVKIERSEQALAAPAPPGEGRKREKNVGALERAVSVAGGGGLVALAIRMISRRRPIVGGLLAVVGAEMLNRGVTGRCAAYEALGFHRDDATFFSNPLSRETTMVFTVTIDKPADELYRFWRHLPNLPEFMHRLRSIEVIDEKTSHWVMAGPGERKFEWDSVITADTPNELISWSSVKGSEVRHRGNIHFIPSTGGRGTTVRLEMKVHLPGGTIGAVIARITGQDPSQEARENLRRFKQLMESGEFPSTKGQPRGQCV